MNGRLCSACLCALGLLACPPPVGSAPRRPSHPAWWAREAPPRFLFAGDLSGSGQPTEPDLETFLVNSQPQAFGSLGIDLTHANHHARNTSSNLSYVQAAAPNDGRTRSVITGINTAYVNSPHQGTLDAWTAGGRLGAGRMFVTKRAPAGAQGPGLVDVDGRVVVQTVEQGGGYWIQSLATPSLRR